MRLDLSALSFPEQQRFTIFVEDVDPTANEERREALLHVFRVSYGPNSEHWPHYEQSDQRAWFSVVGVVQLASLL